MGFFPKNKIVFFLFHKNKREQLEAKFKINIPFWINMYMILSKSISYSNSVSSKLYIYPSLREIEAETERQRQTQTESSIENIHEFFSFQDSAECLIIFSLEYQNTPYYLSSIFDLGLVFFCRMLTTLVPCKVVTKSICSVCQTALLRELQP